MTNRVTNRTDIKIEFSAVPLQFSSFKFLAIKVFASQIYVLNHGGDIFAATLNTFVTLVEIILYTMPLGFPFDCVLVD